MILLSRCADIDLNLDGGLNRQPSVAEADPFLAFSSGDLADMDKEVEDILSGDSDSDSELGDGGVSQDLDAIFLKIVIAHIIDTEVDQVETAVTFVYTLL